MLVILRVLGKLDTKDAKRFLGTLYVSYKPWCQWWYEPYALSRRLVIVILVVFLGDIPDVLWPVLLTVLLLFQIIQFICRPYISWIENIAEELSLSALILITAINMVSSSPVEASAASGISLAIFLIALFTIIFALVYNHWLSRLIVEALGLKSKFLKAKSELSKLIKRRKE